MSSQIWQGVDLEKIQPNDAGEKKAYNKNGNLVYAEDYSGAWEKWEYDEAGHEIFFEYSNDKHYWSKKKYDDHGNLIFHEDSNGYWEKHTFDELNNLIFYEDSNGYWEKRDYEGVLNVYYEDSDGYWSKTHYDASGKKTGFEDSEGKKEGD